VGGDGTFAGSFLGWTVVAGVLLLGIALSNTYLRRLPISTSALYLGVGLALSPLWGGWLHVEIAHDSKWFESLTEVAVVVSLFIGGLKLRLPFRAAAWRAVPRLAGPVMLVSIAGLACFAHYVLHLEPPFALLLGAVLAPTDPVLASTVSVTQAADYDRMRYGLSGEAGLNDGMAFPFVVLALDWVAHGTLGRWVTDWALIRVLWAIPAALLLGYAMGVGVGRLAVALRTRDSDGAGPSDFLALALIALSYAAAQLIGAWGFLAVFAAGVGLRRAEIDIVRCAPHPDAAEGCADAIEHPPAEDLVAPKASARSGEEPAVAVGTVVGETLSFGRTAERLLELTLVVLVGLALAQHWDGRAIWVALILFFVLRPLATLALLVRTPTTTRQRWLMGWFGVRGIGSLYYAAYALTRGPAGSDFQEVTNLAVSVVAISVVLHGVSAQPLLALYERSLVGGRTSDAGGLPPSQLAVPPGGRLS
jgi:sodium/hydrogen antiporter